MKKFFFGVIATVLLLLADTSNAQTQAKPQWPFGCRKWTVGVNVLLFSFTSEVTLCCTPANWKNPPISCTEIRQSGPTGNIYQYIMIAELETISGKKIEGTEIEISSENQITEEGINYKLKKDFYPIETNEKNERFVKVLFEKV